MVPLLVCPHFMREKELANDSKCGKLFEAVCIGLLDPLPRELARWTSSVPRTGSWQKPLRSELMSNSLSNALRLVRVESVAPFVSTCASAWCEKPVIPTVNQFTVYIVNLTAPGSMALRALKEATRLVADACAHCPERTCGIVFAPTAPIDVCDQRRPWASLITQGFHCH